MIKRGFIAGVAILIVGLGINWLVGALIPAIQAEYQNINLFRPWTDPLMMAFFAYPFVLGVVAAYFWDLLKGHLTGKPLEKAFKFAKIYFIVATIPGMLISYSSFQISLGMILVWTLTGFLESLTAGFVFAKLK